jgi:hypothetical protein
MSNALASNRPTVREAITSLCNSHARRQFVDFINHFPDEVEHNKSAIPVYKRVRCQHQTWCNIRH